jgi:hypothetical protein
VKQVDAERDNMMMMFLLLALAETKIEPGG